MLASGSVHQRLARWPALLHPRRSAPGASTHVIWCLKIAHKRTDSCSMARPPAHIWHQSLRAVPRSQAPQEIMRSHPTSTKAARQAARSSTIARLSSCDSLGPVSVVMIRPVRQWPREEGRDNRPGLSPHPPPVAQCCCNSWHFPKLTI